MQQLSGELFDLTITSINNLYGYHKIKYSLEYGIQSPLSKYIEELETILQITSDGKNEKRKIRLGFLRLFQGNSFFEQYFQKVMGYLNGGTPMNRNHNDNKIIITVAGGNIITIFAYLVNDLLENNKTHDELSEFNKTYNRLSDYHKLNKKYISLIQQYLQQYNIFLLQNFSDFDYNLLPNKPNNIVDRNKELRKLERYKHEDSHSQGFILMRVKTLIKDESVKYRKYTNKQGIHSCNLIKKKLKKQIANNPDISYIPQLLDKKQIQTFKHNMKTLYTQLNKRDYTICSDYLDFIVNKKESISKETTFNIQSTIKTYEQGYSEPVTVNDVTVRSEKLAPISGHSKHGKLNSIMKYLHTVTSSLNMYIKLWENQVLAINRGRFTKYDCLTNFKSLYNISVDKKSKLLYLSSYLIQVFLNAPELHTEKILDNILDEKKRIGMTKCIMSPSNLILVPSFTAFNDLKTHQQQERIALSKAKFFLEKEMYSDFGYPDGINITINSISTTNSIEIEKDKVTHIEIINGNSQPLKNPRYKDTTMWSSQFIQKNRERRKTKKQMISNKRKSDIISKKRGLTLKGGKHNKKLTRKNK
jgi:hypothetical protein